MHSRLPGLKTNHSKIEDFVTVGHGQHQVLETSTKGSRASIQPSDDPDGLQYPNLKMTHRVALLKGLLPPNLQQDGM
jgi:hypothetical protein